MPAEAVLRTVRGEVIRKVQSDNVLLQIAAVRDVKDVGIVLPVLFCICLGKLALADPGDAPQEHLAVLRQKRMQLRQFGLPAAEVPAGGGRLRAVDQIRNRGRQRSAGGEGLSFRVPLHKVSAHAETERGCQEFCRFLRPFTGVVCGKLLLFGL